MSIGGVPSLPENTLASSLQRLEAAEDRLVDTYNQVESLLAMSPDLKSFLQSILDVIGVNFTKIKNMKSDISSQGATSMSPDEISKLNSEIDDLIAQITTVYAEIMAKIQAIKNLHHIINDMSQKIATEEASINTDNAKLSELNQSLQAAQNRLDSDNIALASLHSRLDSLSSQLQIAHANLNQVIALNKPATPDHTI